MREFEEVLKSAFISVASKQIGMSGGDPTAEAIAVLLNVDTSEIENALAAPKGEDYEHQKQQNSPVVQVLAAWHTDPKYSGPYGVLVDLPFVREDGGDRRAISFSELSRQCCPSISPKILLDEAIRTGCVVSVGSGFFRAIRRSYIPEPLSAFSISRFAHVVHNLCETLERNLRTESGGTKGLFERTIFSDNRITQTDLRAFDLYVRERGQIFADDIDNWLSSRPPTDVSDLDLVHTGVGIYHYVLNEEDEREFSQSGITEGKKNAH